MNDYHSIRRGRGYAAHLLRSFTVALLLTVTACSSLPRSTLAPDVTLASLSVVEATADGQRFRLGLLLDNPNAYALPVASLRFSVRLGGQGIMSGESRAPLTIPALGTETLRLEIETDLVSSVSRLLALVQGPDDGVRYELNGRVVLASGMDRTLPFSVSGIVPLSATMGGR